VDDVVLRNVAHLLAEQIVIAIEIGAVEEDFAGGGRSVAVEGFEQRGLAGAGGAHQRDEFAGVDGERDGIEEARAVGRVDGDLRGFDGNVTVIFAAFEATVGANLKTKTGEADFLAAGDLHFALNALAVDEGAVERTEVFDKNSLRAAGNLRVVPGN
jgi:hypothetical protein